MNKREKNLKYGLLMPIGGTELNTPQKITEFAVLAEQNGWDGFFIWDNIAVSSPDPWITLANIAQQTSTIKIGPMVTALARRRPWQVAKSLISLDHISDGRIIFGAGLGDDIVFEAIGEETDKKERAKILDESLQLLDKFLRGDKFSFNGNYYNLSDVMCEAGIQQPRIPVWIGGLWPAKGPFRRAAKWDGMIPHTVRSSTPGERLELDEIDEIMAFIGQNRSESMDDFQMAMLSYLPEDDREAIVLVKQYHQRGIRWWVESVLEWGYDTLDQVRKRIEHGPPEF